MSRAEAVVLPDGISPSVLVIDSNVECARSLAELLECCGYTARVAIDGRMAVALADPPPDIIVIELAIPDIDGFELVRRLRALAAAKKQLVIAVTVLSCEDDVPAKIDLHFLKPAEPRLLLSALARFARTLTP